MPAASWQNLPPRQLYQLALSIPAVDQRGEGRGSIESHFQLVLVDRRPVNLCAVV